MSDFKYSVEKINKIIKRITKNWIKEVKELDNALSNNYKSEDITAEIARDNYRLYQEELAQRGQDYIEKWCEKIKTASREGKKYIYTNSFLIIGDGNKILLVCDDDGRCYDFSPDSSIERFKEYFEERGFNVLVEKDANDWCRLTIKWID